MLENFIMVGEKVIETNAFLFRAYIRDGIQKNRDKIYKILDNYNNVDDLLCEILNIIRSFNNYDYEEKYSLYKCIGDPMKIGITDVKKFVDTLANEKIDSKLSEVELAVVRAYTSNYDITSYITCLLKRDGKPRDTYSHQEKEYEAFTVNFDTDNFRVTLTVDGDIGNEDYDWNSHGYVSIDNITALSDRDKSANKETDELRKKFINLLEHNDELKELFLSFSTEEMARIHKQQMSE